jgi:trans-2,3-dihydro-3-hydroxyanthranilate isomerase
VNQSVACYWVDAFTQTPFTGNPAVVVPDADGLDDAQKQALAREVNCSETAFVLSPTIPDADFQLRWFTPTQEVDLCGHATIATLHTLAGAGRFNLRRGTTQILYLQTRSGVLSVTVDFMDETDAPWIWLGLPTADFKAVEADLLAPLQAALGLPASWSPVLAPVVDTLNHDLLLPIEGLALLHALHPNMSALAALGQSQQWRGVSVYTLETVSPENHLHSRFFAPQSGIPEDPVTGSVSGPLALYLQAQGLIKDNLLTLEQGDCLNRPGRLRIDLTDSSLGPRLGGQAITVLRGELLV